MTPPYPVIIVDDEPPARAIVEVFVARVPDLACVALCANAHQALEAIHRLKPDLIFLDIQMPQMSGFDLLNQSLPVQPAVILTTAFPDFALKSYEYAVIDYLMKPIAFDRFLQAIDKFRGNRPQSTVSPGWRAIENTPPDSSNTLPTPPGESAVWLREEKRLLQIPYEDILYVEGMKDYVKVFLKDQMIVTHLNIGKAEALFPPPVFVRIHRSHIVRRSAIRLIDGNLIRLTNGTELQIGPLYRNELKKFISALR